MANITYLPSEVKAVVKKKSPAQYRDDLDKLMDEKEIVASLASLDLDPAIFEVDESSVEAFLSERRKKMAMRLKSYYDSL